MLVIALRLGKGLRAIEPLVLPKADGPLPMAGLFGVGGATCVSQDAGDVIAVQNGELWLQTQGFAVFTQQAHTQRVKGADQQFACGFGANQRFGPLAHFCGRFVGKGDRGNLRRRQICAVPRLQQARNFLRDHARFA